MSAGALTIGAAARLARVPAWKLRAWESAGLLEPARSDAGYRIYSQGDIERIRILKRRLDSAGRLGVHALRADPGSGVPAVLVGPEDAGPHPPDRHDRGVKEVEAVYAVMHAQRGTAEVRRSVEVGLEHLLDVIEWDAAAVHSMNRAGQRFELVAQAACSEEFIEAIAGWGLGQGLGGRALLAAEPIVVPEFRTDPRVQPHVRELYGAWAGMPLIAFGRKVGLLEVMSIRPRELPGDDLEFAQMVGGLIAAAVASDLSRAALTEAEHERDRLVRGWADQLAGAEADHEQLLERVLDGAVAGPLKTAVRSARNGASPEVLEAAVEAAVTAVDAIGRSASGRTGTGELLKTLLRDGLAGTVASLPGSFELEVEDWPTRLSVAAATQFYDLVRTVALDFLRDRGASSVVLSMRSDNTGISIDFRSTWTMVPMQVAPDPETARRIGRLIDDLDADGERIRRGRVEQFALSVPMAGDAAHLSLTARQTEIVEALSRGLTRCEIGSFLGISEKTVQNHLSSAYKRLGARNRSQAIANAISARLIPPP